MLAGLVLMITALVLMYKCARGKSCRRKMESLADSITSDKEEIDFWLNDSAIFSKKCLPTTEKNPF